ncbi:alpha/beta hydrolase family protein [Confluentibacter sediminis]|uniref:alpha/beta hydrolase family protein n=1 Tax=Confluentibacter sediminis TaxID=2219045 RepID=UPI000DAC6154|nr:prolyl oligopeptidase family serine peptidase [Confluentibacter sediminis]
MKYTILIYLLFLCSLHVQAQKKEVDTTAYKTWKRIDKKSLSFNGEWMFYSAVYQDIDQENENEIILKNIKNDRQLILKNTEELNFIGTKDWVKYTKNDSTFLYSLATNKKRFWNVKDYTQSIKGTDLLFYIQYGPYVNGKSLKKIVYYDIEKNDSIVIRSIKDFSIIDDRKLLVFAQEINNETYLKSGRIGGVFKTLYKCESSNFGDFTLNSKKEGGSFTMKSPSSTSNNLLFYFNIETGVVKQVLDYDTVKWEDSLYTFSRIAYPLEADTKIIPLQLQANFNKYENSKIEKSDIDIWSWNQGALERRLEKLRGEKESSKDPYYVYNLKKNECFKIDSGEYSQIIAPNLDHYTQVFKTTTEGYEVEVDWKFNEPHDLYLLNLETNKKSKVMENIIENPYWNSSGTYAILYNEKDRVWMSLNPADKKPEFRVIGEQIKYPLWDVENDFGEYSKSYGIAGWLNEGKTLVVYDEYDLWAIDLTGNKKPYSITNEFGRKNKIRLRLNNTSTAEDLTLDTEILLKSFNKVTKAKGVYRLKKHLLTKLIEQKDSSINIQEIAGNGKSYLFTNESYTCFPNLWWANKDFKNKKQITNLNVQQTDYAWGNAKLVSWKNFKNNNNEGILYLPENYDANKSYPVIVHFYEKHTEDLYKYHIPEYSSSNIDIPTYVSKGYVVFQPDIHYVYNQPGMSAYNATVSGVQYLIEKKIAAKDHIGIQGHSFGGYETSFLLTKTDVFNCAIVGSGVSNFTSNYFSYRTNGLSNLFKYEVDQYRMKDSFFEEKEKYIENSPIFHVENNHTPTLIFHNDHDLAVPFQEGMSLFLALRRLGKESWLINYKNEGHTLSEYQHQKDWTNKMQAFFDFYLKNSIRPEWM